MRLLCTHHFVFININIGLERIMEGFNGNVRASFWCAMFVMSATLSAFSTPTIAQTAQTDIAITVVDSVDPVVVGSNVDHTVTVTNTGIDATVVLLTFVPGPAPTGVTFDISSPPSKGTFDGSTWNVTGLNNGESATLVIPISVSGSANPGDVITTSWSLAASDPTDSNPAKDQDSEQTTIAATPTPTPTPTPTSVPVLPLPALGLLTAIMLGFGLRRLRRG